MSLHDISKKRVRLATEYKELTEYKARIIRDFEVAFATVDETSWKISEACIQLQVIMTKVRNDMKINQAKSLFYKKMYKRIQRTKNSYGKV